MPKHGTRNEYVRHGCRCDPCREATRVYEQQRRENNPKVREQAAARQRRWTQRNPEKARAHYIGWKERNPERYAENDRRRKERHRLKMYALDDERHAALMAAQNGLCAICHAEDDRALSIDHDHATGRIRGLLCRPCNLGLGCFGEDPVVLKAAIAYLRRASRQQVGGDAIAE